jgi:hypothetical protein
MIKDKIECLLSSPIFSTDIKIWETIRAQLVAALPLKADRQWVTTTIKTLADLKEGMALTQLTLWRTPGRVRVTITRQSNAWSILVHCLLLFTNWPLVWMWCTKPFRDLALFIYSLRDQMKCVEGAPFLFMVVPAAHLATIRILLRRDVLRAALLWVMLIGRN